MGEKQDGAGEAENPGGAWEYKGATPRLSHQGQGADHLRCVSVVG